MSAYTPASNGVAERINLFIMNDVKSILVISKLPSYFWCETATHSTFHRNYVIKDRISDSPATYVGYKPLNVKDIHEFGEKCYARLLPQGAKTDLGSVAASYLVHRQDSMIILYLFPKLLVLFVKVILLKLEM